jgi:hypothetical protein
MEGRSIPIVPTAGQIDVLAYNAASGACHRHRDGFPGGVPGIHKRVVLPGLVSFCVCAIETAEHVDFAVDKIIRSARQIPAIRHGSARGPYACNNVVDLGDVQDIGTCANAAEYINRVGIRGVNSWGKVEGSRNVRQGRPGVSNRIIGVKGIGGDGSAAARSIRQDAIAGHTD